MGFSRVTPEAIREAVREAILEAVSDPKLWEAAGKAMRVQAQSAAGGWLFDGLRNLLTRAAWIAAAIIAIYALGGWSAVIAWFKTGGLSK